MQVELTHSMAILDFETVEKRHWVSHGMAPHRIAMDLPSSSTNDGSANTNPVEECLARTERKLMDWIEQRKDGGSCRDDPSVNVGATSDTNAVDDDEECDPDDLAAAFFARQAQQRRYEEAQKDKTLRDWADVVIRCNHQPAPKDEVSKNQTTIQADPTSTESLADGLFADYRRIVSRGP